MDFTDITDVCTIEDMRYTLIKYNLELIRLIDNNDDYRPFLNGFKESGISNYKSFLPALYSLNVIGERYYIKDIDITLLMHEYIYSRKLSNKSLKKCFESIDEEVMKLTDSMMYGLSNNLDPENVFTKYIKKLNELHTQTFNNRTDFIYCLKQVINLKRSCEFRLKFRISNLNSSEVIEILRADDKNVSFKLIDDILNNPVLNDYETVDMKHWKKYFEVYTDNSSLSDFLTNDLEFGRTISSAFLSGKPIKTNIKQYIMNLALYIELPLFENVERFMRINGYSLNSTYETINEYSNLYDRDIKHLVESGIDRDVIFYILRKFGETRQKRG